MHYWADFQAMHGFRCYDSIHVCKLITLKSNANSPNAKCQRVLVLALWLVWFNKTAILHAILLVIKSAPSQEEEDLCKLSS